MKRKILNLPSAVLACVTMALLFATACAPVPAMAAPPVPGSYELAVPYGTATADWEVPTYANGWLLAFYAGGVTNGATLAVSHITPIGTGGLVTNTVSATAAAATWHAWPTEYVAPVTSYYVTNNVILSSVSAPLKPVPLVPGDKLRFTLSATNGQATVVIRAGGR